MDNFNEFLISSILENPKKYYEFALIGKFINEVNFIKEQIHNIKKNINFDFDFYFSFFDTIDIFTKYYKYDYIFCDFVDHFILSYHLNPRIFQNGYIIISNEFYFNETYLRIYNNVYKKVTNNDLILYEDETFDYLSEDYLVEILLIKSGVNDDVNVVNKLAHDDKNIFFMRDKVISIPTAGGVGETFVFLTIFEEILINSKFVNLFIDIRFHTIIIDNFKEYENKFFLNIDSSYSFLSVNGIDDLHYDSVSLFRFFRPSVENFRKFSLKNNRLGTAVALQLPHIVKNLYSNRDNLKFCGISFGTKTERSEVNVSISDFKKLMIEKKDTIFFIFQYRVEDYEDELEFIRDDKDLDGRVQFLLGLDTENDFYSANTLYSYFDYFISIDNSSLFQFAMSGTDTYYIKKVSHYDEIPSVQVIQHFDDNCKWLYFDNVREIYIEDSYSCTIEFLYKTIEREQYKSNKTSFWNSDIYFLLTELGNNFKLNLND